MAMLLLPFLLCRDGLRRGLFLGRRGVITTAGDVDFLRGHVALGRQPRWNSMWRGPRGRRTRRLDCFDRAVLVIVAGITLVLGHCVLLLDRPRWGSLIECSRSRSGVVGAAGIRPRRLRLRAPAGR